MQNKFIKSLLLAFAAIVVYYPILNNDFTFGWDDQWMVVNQYTEGGINIENIWAILSGFYHGQYGPVNQMLFLFLYTTFGYNPLAFHLTILLLHVGCIILIFSIIQKLFALTPRIRYPYANEAAFFTSLLFAVHPLNVETVAWISAVKVLTYSFFYLAATYTYLLFREKRKIRYYNFSLLLFSLSFGGKEQAVIFPVWLLMIQLLLCNDLKKLKSWKSWRELVPFFCLSLFFGVISIMAQASGGMGMFMESSFPFWQRVLFACYSFTEYLVKFVFPYKLLYIYPFPIAIGEPMPGWMLLYPVLFLVVAITLWKYIKKWYIVCGLAFFFINIVLVLHIIPISRYSIVADRYIYMASIGLSFIVVCFFIPYFKAKSRGMIVLFAGIILCLMIRSNLRCFDWKDSQTIKKDFLELLHQRPDSIPHKLDDDWEQ